MHMTVIRMRLNLRTQNITEKYTCVHKLRVRPSYNTYIKHAAHRLVQHMLQVEMVWTDDSTLAIFFHMRYR